MPGSQSNLAWATLLDLASESSGARHEQLRRALRAAIRTGRLAVGSALPPSRQLAADLGCSRWVVTEAYGQLVAEGYLEGRAGSATRVRWSGGGAEGGRAPEALARKPRFDLTPGLPDLRAFPHRRWAAALRSQAARVPFPDLGYPPLGGSPRLRQVLADYLRRCRAAMADAEDVMISTGVLDAVVRVCRVMHATGITSIAVEDPSEYAGATRIRLAVESTGVRTVPLPVDEQGLVVDALVTRTDLRAVLVTPAHQFPTGAVLAPARRAALLEWARSVDGLVLEDDYDAEFRYDRRPVTALQGMDPSRVCLFGSLSKTMSPALRMGWMVVPPGWADLLIGPGLAVPSPPILDQLAFAEFVETGAYDRHLRSSRQRYRARRDLLVRGLAKHLPECRVSGAAAGLHLMLHLCAETDPAVAVAEAAARGVEAVDLGVFGAAATAGRALVLGYGNLADSAVDEAVTRLATAIRASRRTPGPDQRPHSLCQNRSRLGL